MSKFYLYLSRFICIALIGLIPVLGFAQDEQSGEEKEKLTRKEITDGGEPQRLLDLLFCLEMVLVSDRRAGLPKDLYQQALLSA